MCHFGLFQQIYIEYTQHFTLAGPKFHCRLAPGLCLIHSLSCDLKTGLKRSFLSYILSLEVHDFTVGCMDF